MAETSGFPVETAQGVGLTTKSNKFILESLGGLEYCFANLLIPLIYLTQLPTQLPDDLADDPPPIQADAGAFFKQYHLYWAETRDSKLVEGTKVYTFLKQPFQQFLPFSTSENVLLEDGTVNLHAIWFLYYSYYAANDAKRSKEKNKQSKILTAIEPSIKSKIRKLVLNDNRVTDSTIEEVQEADHLKSNKSNVPKNTGIYAVKHHIH